MKKPFQSLIFLLMIFGCVIAANAQTMLQVGEDKIYARSEVDKNARILTRPRPRTDGQCARGSSGIARFDVILRKSGKVEIQKTLHTSGCERFDGNAVRALKDITFEPAMKDGQPVSVLMKMEFSYSTY